MNRYLIILFLGLPFAGLGQAAVGPQKKGAGYPVHGADTVGAWREAYFSGRPQRIGNKVQFLFDDYMVEDRFGLKRSVGLLEKYAGNPLRIGDDMPWETKSESWSGAYIRHVVYDPLDKHYKGWYLLYRREPGVETGYNYSTLYAESEDGIDWKKPELDFFRIDGHKTNLVLHKEKGTALLQDIILDTATADPERRYAALVKMVPPGEKERCIVLMFSPDGKQWRLAPDPVLFRGANDGAYSLVRDNSNGRWLLYRRPPTNALVKPGLGVYGSNPVNPSSSGMNTKRRMSVSVSWDMKNWSYPRGLQVLDEPDDENIGISGNGRDIDWATVTRYGDVYFGFIHLMDNLTLESPRECQLMWSRDGFRWERLPQRIPFIANGADGDWDSGGIITLSLMSDQKRTWIYYTGTNVPQGERRIAGFTGSGLAYLEKDRFIGQQAGSAGGYLLTRQFILEGSSLELNFQSQVRRPPANWGSIIKAELLQAPSDQMPAIPYPGFSMEDCDGITAGEGFDQVMTWRGSPDLSTLKGKPVYIRFYLQNTTLYTLRIGE